MSAALCGLDGAWVRSRHLERGIGSAATFLAAASQHTRRIELGAAVIQLRYKGVFRLAEDLATADGLSRARLQIGVSASGRAANRMRRSAWRPEISRRHSAPTPALKALA